MTQTCDYTGIIDRLNKLEERLVRLEQTKPTGDIRSKRAPSKYNLFMKSCLTELKGTGKIQDLFRQCARRYKEQKKA